MRRFPTGPPNRSTRSIAARFFLAGIALLVFIPTSLSAQPVETKPERRVLLIVDKPNDPFIQRIRAEISALGLSVVMRPYVGPLEVDARAQRAVAAIRVLPSRNGVEVWMADETSGRSLLRQLIVDEKPEGPDQTLIALQTAELLRTSLFPKIEGTMTSTGTEPARKDQAVSASVTDRPTSIETHASAKTGVQAGFGILHSFGGTGSALQVWLSLRHSLGKRIGVALVLSGPVHRANVRGLEGSADVGVVLVGGEIFTRFEKPGLNLYLTTGLGAAVARVSAEGHTQTPLMEATSNTITSAGYARLDAGWQPSRWLRLGLAALAGAAFSPVTVRFAGNEASTWGWPVLSSFLFTELDWN
jgi:hypothetical protein